MGCYRHLGGVQVGFRVPGLALNGIGCGIISPQSMGAQVRVLAKKESHETYDPKLRNSRAMAHKLKNKTDK